MLENTHQMHEKSGPVIFNVVGGAGQWKSSENRGLVEGRDVWGSTSALFYCADVASGDCSMVHSSLSSLSGNFSSLSSLLLSLFSFSHAAQLPPVSFLPSLLLLAIFSLSVFHLNSVWPDMLGLLLLHSTET